MDNITQERLDLKDKPTELDKRQHLQESFSLTTELVYVLICLWVQTSRTNLPNYRKI